MGFLQNRRLARNGVEATATVVAIRQHDKVATNDWRRYDLILDVQAPDRPAFRVETHEQMLLGGFKPKAGEVIRVLVDPQGTAVRLQLDGDPRYDLKARRTVEAASYDQLLHQPPGA